LERDRYACLMTRAAADRTVDFSAFDPWDPWSWKRLGFLLKEQEERARLIVATTQHQHWLALLAIQKLATEKIPEIQEHANTALNQIVGIAYPWMKKLLGEQGIATARKDAVTAYHEQFGYPGEPRYEIMMDNLRKVFAKGKLSPEEKILARAARRRRQSRRAE